MTEFSTIHCGHFSKCSGCDLQAKILHPPIYQEMKEYFSLIHLVDFPLYHAEITGWRTRAKLAIRGSKEAPEIGLFKQGTHDVETILDCPLHHPSINEAAKLLRHEMIANQIVPYEEKKQTGDLRYAQFTVERRTKKVQLVLVVNGNTISPPVENLIKKLSQNTLLHSLWVNFQSGSTNVIFGKEWQRCFGEEDLWENLGGHEICFHPACFIQAHLSVFEMMLSTIKQMAPAQKKVVEFYAGVGVIGLSLLEKSKGIICSEINPFSHESFEKTKAKLSTDFQQRIFLEVGDAARLSFLANEAELIIIDPPRKGIDRKLREAILASSSAKDLIYVSCGFPSFKRDMEDFLKAGWRMKRAEGYLLFPGSDHVEVVALLQKESV